MKKKLIIIIPILTIVLILSFFAVLKFGIMKNIEQNSDNILNNKTQKQEAGQEKSAQEKPIEKELIKEELNKEEIIEDESEEAEEYANKYDKSQTMTFDEYLYAPKTDEDWKDLKLNENEDVIYKNKVVLNDKGIPLSDKTAFTTIEIKVVLAAMGVKPKEGCDPSDTAKNGTLGCYIDDPDEIDN